MSGNAVAGWCVKIGALGNAERDVAWLADSGLEHAASTETETQRIILRYGSAALV